METQKAGAVGKRRIPKPNNIFNITPKSTLAFFKWWCTFLRPFVNLTDREIEILACFLKKRFELSRVILDPTVLDKTIMTDDVKQQVMDECNVSQKHFYVRLSRFKRKGIIVNDMLNPKLVPNIKMGDDGNFRLLIWFNNIGTGT